MTSCTSVTTIGMIVKGLATQVASAIMPTFITCASIWPKPASGLPRPASAGPGCRRAHHRVDDVAGPQGELLHRAVDAGVDDRLVELDLGLRASALRRSPSAPAGAR